MTGDRVDADDRDREDDEQVGRWIGEHFESYFVGQSAAAAPEDDREGWIADEKDDRGEEDERVVKPEARLLVAGSNPAPIARDVVESTLRMSKAYERHRRTSRLSSGPMAARKATNVQLPTTASPSERFDGRRRRPRTTSE